jgi:hypothetical protein
MQNAPLPLTLTLSLRERGKNVQTPEVSTIYPLGLGYNCDRKERFGLMAIRCSGCGRDLDVALFQFGQKVRCACGREVELSAIETFDDFKRYFDSIEEREKVDEIQREADQICQMILSKDHADVDIEIAKARLRSRVEELFPDKMHLYPLIYESRFKRLWEQFRGRPEA